MPENNTSTENPITYQTGIKQHNFDNLDKYALFLGGLNVTHDALEQYDPLRTGYGRIFMIRTPLFVQNGLGDAKMRKFKHILEYGNTGITGNGNITLANSTMTGGYANRSVEIPTVAEDSSNDLTISVYEFAGSPIREVIQYWITGIADLQSGYSTYHRNGNSKNDSLPSSLSNETAEFVYVATDQTGLQVEYAALWASAWPTEINLQHFDFTSGQHDLAQYEIRFNAVRYMSPKINELASNLIKKYNVLMDSLNFNPGYSISNDASGGSYYDIDTGKFAEKTTPGSYDSSTDMFYIAGKDGKIDGQLKAESTTANVVAKGDETDT